MKTIGLIGGMSWESSTTYYRIINEEVKERMGGFHSAKCILYSVDFNEIELYQRAGDWEKAGHVLGDVAKSLALAGADLIVLCTNTMHKVASHIETNVCVPLLHIADITGKKVISDGIKRVGLLGTRYTMEQDFYKSRLVDGGIEVVIPDQMDREIVNKIIFQELCLGIITPESKSEYIRIIRRLIDQGAEGIILGCTEIGLLIKQTDLTVPVYDTTIIHAKGAVDYALG